MSRVVAVLLLVSCARESGPLGASNPGFGGSQSSDCVPDDLEPNDTSKDASLLLLGSALTAQVCLADEDFFRIDSSGAAGHILRVRVDRLQGEGQLQARVSGLGSGARFDGQAPSGVERLEIGVVADGGIYSLVVSLAGIHSRRSGRAYTVRVDRLSLAANDCCSPGAEAGCVDAALLSCLCQLDNACCHQTYDELCIAEARSACDLRCGVALPDSDCCNASAAPGCSVREVADCVCQIDPFCCVGGFDENCVHLAVNRCRVSCASSTPEVP